MSTAYHISTLLYVFDSSDRVLLMHRAKKPNLGLWSPCGGKINTSIGESPYDCAVRETAEELDFTISRKNLHLTGLISESGYEGESHWLMFLFEIEKKLNRIPLPHREGTFQFFEREKIKSLEIPVTDKARIWPLFWKYRGGFFSAHCQCREKDHEWTLEETILP